MIIIFRCLQVIIYYVRQIIGSHTRAIFLRNSSHPCLLENYHNHTVIHDLNVLKNKVSPILMCPIVRLSIKHVISPTPYKPILLDTHLITPDQWGINLCNSVCHICPALASWYHSSKVKSCYNPLRLGTIIVLVSSGIDFVNTPHLYSNRSHPLRKIANLALWFVPEGAQSAWTL